MKKHPTKKSLQERWNNPEFVAENRPYLERVFKRMQFDGPIDLRGLSVGVDGPVELAMWCDLQRAKLAQLDLSCSSFGCSFNDGEFRDIDFSRSKWDTNRMMSSHFMGCIFARSQFRSPWMAEALFQNCDFSLCRIRGTNFCHYGARKTTFDKCDFSDAVIKNIRFHDCRFNDCIFDRTKFERCFIFGNEFHGGAPTMSQFEGCEFRGRNIGLVE